MDNKTLERKLEEFVALGNELDKEAKRRYGKQGWLFHEADGGVHIMDGDADDARRGDRQKHIRFSTHSYAQWGAGAW